MPKGFVSVGLALILTSALNAQGDIAYPSEDYLGGGIGYTPTFLQLDLAKSFPFNIGADLANTDLLSDSGLGFSAADINALGNLFVIHGAEGFGNVTGHWRVGAYVGLGAKSISRVDTSTAARPKVDLKVALMTGSSVTGFTDYMFDPNLSIWLKVMALYHLALPPLLIWLILRLGYDTRTWIVQVVLTWIIILATWFFTNPSLNINFVFSYVKFEHLNMGAIPFLIMLFVTAVVLVGGTHLFLKALYKRYSC